MSREQPSRTGCVRVGAATLADAALFTDLYELTMAAAFCREGVRGEATFSLFVRRLPATRAFLVAAGLEDALEYLRSLRVTDASLAYLRSLGRFEPAFLEQLRALRFTGDVRAVPEGTVVFADEPLLEVTAPILEAQLVETALLNLIHVQTVLASKAARSVLAAGGRTLAEFGLRRSHGIDAGMKAARAALLAGFNSTSNTLAGATWGVPVSGTMAHSFVTAFPSEDEAFRAYARAFPDAAVLLLDTYDTWRRLERRSRWPARSAREGHHLAGVRLDSGDLVALSRGVRRILDEGGFPGVKILSAADWTSTTLPSSWRGARRSTASASAPGSRRRPTRPRWTWCTSWCTTKAGCPQAECGEADLGRCQAGRAADRRRRSPGGRHTPAGGRAIAGRYRRPVGAGHARRRALAGTPGAHGDPNALRGSARTASRERPPAAERRGVCPHAERAAAGKAASGGGAGGVGGRERRERREGRQRR